MHQIATPKDPNICVVEEHGGKHAIDLRRILAIEEIRKVLEEDAKGPMQDLGKDMQYFVGYSFSVKFQNGVDLELFYYRQRNMPEHHWTDEQIEEWAESTRIALKRATEAHTNLHLAWQKFLSRTGKE